MNFKFWPFLVVSLTGLTCGGTSLDELLNADFVSGFDTANNPTVLVSPLDGTTISSDQTFIWIGLEDADGYVFQVASDSDFTTIVFTQNTTESSYTLTANETGDNGSIPPGTYHWRVITQYGSDDVASPSSTILLPNFSTVYVYGDSAVEEQTGSSDAPFQRISPAIDFATDNGINHITVAGGDYYEDLVVEIVSITGGYDPDTWQHDPDNQTTTIFELSTLPVILGDGKAAAGENITVSHLTFDEDTELLFVDMDTITDLKFDSSVSIKFSSGTMSADNNLEFNSAPNFSDNTGLTVDGFTFTGSVVLRKNTMTFDGTTFNAIQFNNSDNEGDYTLTDCAFSQMTSVGALLTRLAISNSTFTGVTAHKAYTLELENNYYNISGAGSLSLTDNASGFVRYNLFEMEQNLAFDGNDLEVEHNAIWLSGAGLNLSSGDASAFSNNTIYLDDGAYAFFINDATPALDHNVIYNADSVPSFAIVEVTASSDPTLFTNNIIRGASGEGYDDNDSGTSSNLNDFTFSTEVGGTAFGNSSATGFSGSGSEPIAAGADVATPDFSTWVINPNGVADRDGSGGWTDGDSGANVALAGPQ